eukprot:COSAG02_NODE_17022_length_1034_cov_154.349733_1_plen_56_part_10
MAGLVRAVRVRGAGVVAGNVAGHRRAMGCMATPPPALRVAEQQQGKTAAQLIGERH